MNDWFLHNWLESVTVETAWSTDITQSAYVLAEDRRALLGKPHRTLSFHWTGLSLDQMNRFVLLLCNLGQSRINVPLYPDQSEATGTAGTPTIACDTTCRRFYAGQQVLIFQRDANGQPAAYETATVSSVASGALTLQSNLVNSYISPATVVPLVNCELSLHSPIDLITDFYGEIRLTLHEVEDNGNAIPPTVGTPGTVVTGAQTASEPVNYMILTPDPTWESPFQRRLVRQGAEYKQGRASLVAATAPRAVFEFDFPFLCAKRAELWFLLQFFDSVRGRLLPFYVVAPNAMWSLVAINSASIDVVPSGSLSDLSAFIQYVALVLNDGTVYIRKVTSWSLVSGNYRAAFANALPGIALADVRRVTHAVPSRLADDSFKEDWATDGVCTVTLSTHEVVDETPYSVSVPGYISDPDMTTNSFRLSVESTDAYASGSSPTLYLTSIGGGANTIKLWSGTAWVARTVSVQPTISGSGCTPNTLYDAFAYWNGAAVQVEKVAWSNSNIGSSTRAVSISQDSISGNWVKTSDPTRRYLGTFMVAGDNNFYDTDGSGGNITRWVWNVNNQVLRSATLPTTSDWTCAQTFWEATYVHTFQDDAYFILGLPVTVNASGHNYVTVPGANHPQVAIALDQNSGWTPTNTPTTATATGALNTAFSQSVAAGSHSLFQIQQNTAAGTINFTGPSQSSNFAVSFLG